MATNWKKVLFEGANIEVQSITSSNTPIISEAAGTFDSTFKVLTGFTGSVATNPFRFRKIDQTGLQNLEGGTTFLITSSDTDSSNHSSNHDASSMLLSFATSNPSYITLNIDGTTNDGITTASLNPGTVTNPYLTGSQQFNIISYSLDIGLTPTDDPAAAINVGVLPGAYRSAYNWGDFYTAFWTNGILANSQSVYENSFFVSNSVEHGGAISPFDLTDAYTNAEGNTETPIYPNLWRNPLGGTVNDTPPIAYSNAVLNGRRSYYWLSASYVGGFTRDIAGNTVDVQDLESAYDGSSNSFNIRTGSVSESFSSVNDSSASLAPFFNNTGDGTDYVDNPNTFLKRGSNFVKSKQVTDPQTGQLVDQINIVHFEENDATNPQGFSVKLGDSDGNLVIEGDLTASAIALSNDGDVALQINVETFGATTPDYNQGVDIGTTTANSHSFTGNVFVSGSHPDSGTLDLVGDFTIKNAFPAEEDIPDDSDGANTNITPAVLLVNSSNKVKEAEISSSNALTAIISGSANDVKALFETRITETAGQIQTSDNQEDDIDDLEDGFTNNADSLENTFVKGIFLGTSSNETSFQSDTIAGSKINLGTDQLDRRIDFQGLSSSLTTVDTIKFHESQHDSGSDIILIFSSESFVTETGIFTTTAEITTEAAALNRYGLRSSNILTGSNDGTFTAADITFISNLADNLPNADAADHFLTGSGTFQDLTSTPQLGSVADENSSTTQGVIDFLLDEDNDAATDPIYKFGATASGLGTDGTPTFAGITIGSEETSGDLTVEGTLFNLDHANMRVEDQFILINSGALKPTDVANSSVNDKDGGIIVGHGDGSGSLFMYDASLKAWGLIGASGSDSDTNRVALDARSFDGSPQVPDVMVRTILHEENVINSHADLPTSIPYGIESTSAVGVMCVSINTEDTNGDLYIHVG